MAKQYRRGDSVLVSYRGKEFGGRVIETKPDVKVKINEGPHKGTIITFGQPS